jgi:hypothetical protein
MGEQRNEDTMFDALMDALLLARRLKPNDRSGLDRRYAVLATELEKVIGFWGLWAVRETELTDEALGNRPQNA